MSSPTFLAAPKVLFVESAPFRVLVFVTVTATALSLIGHLMALQAPTTGQQQQASPAVAPAQQQAPGPAATPASQPPGNAAAPVFATKPNAAPAPVQLQGGASVAAPVQRAAPKLEGTDFGDLK